MAEYITVRQSAADEFVEKKSRFIGYCCQVTTESSALEFIDSIKKKHYDASHNVSAYILREGGLMRFSDDGEPSGKAGIPVLDAMKKNNLTDTVVVATRYFGGTMLGGGGLIRAYSHTASIAIAAAEKVIRRECSLMRVESDYSLYGRISGLIPEGNGVIDDTEFLERVIISFHIAPEDAVPLQRKLADASNGQISAEEYGLEYYTFPYKETL